MVKKETKQIVKYTKDQIITSKKYSDEKDALTVILENAKSYSLSEVDTLYEKFMKGKVK